MGVKVLINKWCAKELVFDRVSNSWSLKLMLLLFG